MNLFATPMLSADPSRVTTCEKPKRSAWNWGLKLWPLSAEHRAKISAAMRGRSVKGEIMTPWGKYHSSTMARDCGIMLGVKNTDNKISLGLKTDSENYYYLKETK
jgi:hypothetical protein